MNLGRIAYEAYRKYAKGISLISGDKLPDWQELRMEVKAAWEAAGAAVAEKYKEGRNGY